MATPPPAGQPSYPPPPGQAPSYPPPPGQASSYPPPPGQAPPAEAPAPAATPGPAPEPEQYPPPPPAKKPVGGGIEGIFLKIAVGGTMLPIILTLAGAVLWGVAYFVFAACFNQNDLTTIKNMQIAANALIGIGVILSFFGTMLLLLVLNRRK